MKRLGAAARISFPWLSNSGRVEVVTAPDVGGVAQVRLRASTDAGDSVEGQFDVQVCN